MNLSSNVERWLNHTAEELIAAAKTAKDKNHFNLAERTVEAVTPTLMKMHEGYLSDVGDIQVMLYVMLDTDSHKVAASVVRQTADGDLEPRFSVCDEQAHDLIAAYLCDFPDALFSVEGGIPLVLIIDVPANSRVPGFLPGERLKRHVTLNNMIDAVQNKWTSKLIIAVPAPKSTSDKVKQMLKSETH
jgi:hypothetical protein